MLEILLPAFLISVVLLGIHSYFGIRIIERNIIFTDLAIGQIAALGASISILWFHGDYIFILSLVAAIMAATLIAFAESRTRYLEAVIGLFYALGLSGVFILLSRSSHGMEQFQNLMAYDILYTDYKDIGITALLYLIIGVLILLNERYVKGRLKEFFFFLTFSLTVTSSVKMAGVLVVFAILLAPSLIASTLLSGKREISGFPLKTLGTAWLLGIMLNICAILISYYADLPTGYTIVFVNTLAAICLSFMIPSRESRMHP